MHTCMYLQTCTHMHTEMWKCFLRSKKTGYLKIGCKTWEKGRGEEGRDISLEMTSPGEKCSLQFYLFSMLLNMQIFIFLSLSLKNQL